MKYTTFMFVGSLMASILASLETFLVFMVVAEGTCKVLEKRKFARVGVKGLDSRIKFEFSDRRCGDITIESSRVTVNETFGY